MLPEKEVERLSLYEPPLKINQNETINILTWLRGFRVNKVCFVSQLQKRLGYK